MRDILKELYDGKIDAVHQKMSLKYKKASDKEIELYKKLKGLLPAELNDLFEEYISANDKTSELLGLERYKIGFKTGLLIGLETKK